MGYKKAVIDAQEKGVLGRHNELTHGGSPKLQQLISLFGNELWRQQNNLPEFYGWSGKYAKQARTRMAEYHQEMKIDNWPEMHANQTGIVASAEIYPEWQIKAEIEERDGSPILINGKPAFRLAGVYSGTSFYSGVIHGNFSGTVAWVRAVNQDIYHFAEMDSPNEAGPEDYILGGVLKDRCSRMIFSYNGIVIPQISIDFQEENSWMNGLGINESLLVGKAIQHISFKMSGRGRAILPRLKNVAGAPVYYVLNKNFFVWITRPGIIDPIFACYVEQADRKDPVS